MNTKTLTNGDPWTYPEYWSTVLGVPNVRRVLNGVGQDQRDRKTLDKWLISAEIDAWSDYYGSNPDRAVLKATWGKFHVAALNDLCAVKL